MRLLEELLDSKAKLRLMEKLFSAEKYAFSISELARLTGMPKSTVAKVITHWEKTNFIKLQYFGKTKTVQINSKFRFLPLLRKLFDKAMKPYTDLVFKIQNLPVLKNAQSVPAVILYGSVAKGDVSGSSDLDLLLITSLHPPEKPLEKLRDELLALSDKYEIQISTAELTRKQLVTRLKENDHFIENVLKNGKIIKGRNFIEYCKRTL